MKDPEAIDDLILRSILGETSRKEEKELREAFTKDPSLLERRQKMAETTRLLAEVHGVPAEPAPAASEPIPFWRQALRSFTPVGSGIAACFIVILFLFPALKNSSLPSIRENNQSDGWIMEFDGEAKENEKGKPAAQSLSSSVSAPTPSPRPPMTSPTPTSDSFSVIEEEPALEMRVRREVEFSFGEGSALADTGSTIAGSGSAPTITTAPTRSENRDLRRGVALAPPSAPQSPAASAPATISYEDFVIMNGGVERQRQQQADLDQVSRSNFIEADSANAPKFAADKQVNLPLGGDMPLVGQLFADESEVEEQFGNKERTLAKLEKSKDSSRRLEPAYAPPPPAPPPPAKFTDTEQDNFSTFSLNVTDVSFQLAARQLEQGLAPDPGSIRQEEFYNAFDYRDPAPASGQPIRFEVESATLPASHNLKVVRLAVKTAAQGREAGKPAQITFAVDNSGSMQRADRKSTIQAAMAKLPEALRPNDRINVVTFATNSRVELLQASPSETTRISAALNSAPEGGTNLEEGLGTAYEIAARYYDPAYENRVVLLSDGIANLGQTEADQLVTLIETNRNQGIAFDGFGIGWENLNDPLLSKLASNGDGQYAFLNAPSDAGETFARSLSGSLQSAARDVKVQVEWNADRVERFRLVGYETHLLKKEDFRNDAVDAAEMSAEETGNAIYLVELKPNGKGPLGTARVRFKADRGQASEELSWIIPNPPVWPEIESASPRLQLGTAAAIFADKLQDSNRFSGVERAQLLAWTQQAQTFFNNPAEIETLANMIRNANFLR